MLTKVDLTLDSALIIQHMLETMRAWISFLIFVEVRAKDDEEEELEILKLEGIDILRIECFLWFDRYEI